MAKNLARAYNGGKLDYRILSARAEAALVSQSVFEAALEIPGYSCEGLLGRGGMGTVYRAHQLAHARPVAVKVLGVAYRDRPEFVARFRREAGLLAMLEHPHIVPMLDSGEAGGVPYIVMRLIDGPNLRDVIRLGPLDPAVAIESLRGIAAALDFAHARGVLHRDVKPHNILVDHGGHVWLADFGLTRLADPVEAITATSAIAGTFDYLAPEIAAGRPASIASDVYALAVTAFQMLTGRLPFGSHYIAGLLQAHAGAARPAASAINPDLSRRVDLVLADGMAARPQDRPSSAKVLVEALAAALELPAHFAAARLDTPVLSVALPASAEGDAAGFSDAETRSAVDARSRSPSPRPGGTRASRSRQMARVLALLVVVTVVVVLIEGRGRPLRATMSARPVLLDAVSASVGTVFDYRDGGGPQGRSVPAGSRVGISCRVEGRSESEDHWWYRLASSPWDQQFYAPASGFRGSRGTYDPVIPLCTGAAEVAGNAGGSYTWSNYLDAGGQQGPKLPSFRPVDIACRLRGMRVQDGNVWWYRIAEKPWNGNFYISADAFYNNGETHGSLHGTAFVDTKVPLCGTGKVGA